MYIFIVALVFRSAISGREVNLREGKACHANERHKRKRILNLLLPRKIDYDNPQGTHSWIDPTQPSTSTANRIYQKSLSVWDKGCFKTRRNSYRRALLLVVELIWSNRKDYLLDEKAGKSFYCTTPDRKLFFVFSKPFLTLNYYREKKCYTSNVVGLLN